MIQFKYKTFNKDAQETAKTSSSKPGWGSTALGVGFGALTGYGMIEASKGHKESMKQGREGLESMSQQTAAINKNLDQLEKSFGIPLLAGAGGMVAMTAAPMIQSSMQMGDQKEMNEEQVAAQDRQTKAIQRQNALLQRIEQRGGSPEQAALVTRREFSSLEERDFGEIGTAAKDLWKAGKSAGMGKGIKSNLKFGIGMAGLAYGVNKYISHDMKKSGLDIDKQGNLVQKQQQRAYSSDASPSPKAKKGLLREGGPLDKVLGPGIVVAMEAPRVVGYHQEKKALKNQINGTNLGGTGSVMQSRSYSEEDGRPSQGSKKRGKALAIGAGVVGTAALGTLMGHKGMLGKRIQNMAYFQHPGRTITGTMNTFGSFGVTNTKTVQDTAQHLSQNAKSKSMRKFGNWADKHKTLANVAALVPGAAIGWTAFGLGEKVVKKPTRALDPGAYKYQDTKDKIANG